MKAGRVSLVAVLLLAAALSARGEAWPRGKGKVYAHLGYALFSADTLYDTTGEIRPFPGRDTEEERWNLYLEAGLTDSLTLVASLPWKSIRTRGNVSTFESSGLADLDVRLRQSYGYRSTWLGFEAGVGVPAGYDEQEFPQLGTGEVDWTANIAIGTSLFFLPEGFLAADVGYRWKGGEVSDQVPFSLKVGAFPQDRLGVFAFVRGWDSRADWRAIQTDFGLRASDSERVTAGLELYVRIDDRLDLNFVWSDPLSGRNTGDGSEWMAGVAWKGDLTRFF